MLTIALGKAVASLWSAGHDLQAMDVKWPAPVGNTFDKPCVWPFLESCGYWSEKWTFQQIKLDKFGTCKGTGNWIRAAQKRTTWRISQTKLSFSVPKWSRTFFWGSFGFTRPVPQMGRLWGYGAHLFIHFFVHEFLLSFINSSFSNRNICVANKCLSIKHYSRKLCVNKVGPYLSFGITQSLSVSGASSIALVPCGGMTSDVGPINATSNQGSTHAKFFFWQSKCGKLFPGDAWRD